MRSSIASCAPNVIVLLNGTPLQPLARPVRVVVRARVFVQQNKLKLRVCVEGGHKALGGTDGG